MTSPAVEAADAAFARARFGDAKQLYAEAIEAHPEDAHAVLRLGRLQLYANQLCEAQRTLGTAGDLLPDDRRVSRFLAESFYRQDDFTAAASLLAASHEDGTEEARTRVRKLAAFAGQTPYDTTGPDPATINFLETDPLPLVELRVNGSDPIVMFIDSGAGEIGVDSELATELGLPSYGAAFTALPSGLTTAVNHSRLEEVRIGPLSVRNVPVWTLPTRRYAPVWGDRYRIDGVIGTMFLAHFLATMDHPDGKLVLRRRSQDKQMAFRDQVAVPFWMAEIPQPAAKENNPRRGTFLADHVMMLAWGKINNSPQIMIVDSGSTGGWWGPKSSIDAAGVETPPEHTDEGLGKITPFSLAELSLGDAVETDQPGSFGAFSQENANDFRIGGMIGHPFLRHYRFTLDFDEMSYYLDRA